MKPTKLHSGSIARDTHANTVVKQVIAIVDELSVVIKEENQILARGMPASLSMSVTRKNELADAFEQCVKEVAEQQLFARVTDEKLRRRLLDRIKMLHDVMAENVTRLRAAMDASRRRIDAVMRAIRTEVSGASPYGPNGRLRDSRTAHSIRGNGVRV